MTNFSAMAKGAAYSTDELIAAIQVLTPTKIAEIAVDNELTEAQLRLLLFTDKISDEKRDEIMLSYSAIMAKKAEAGANTALAFSFKNLLVAMKPMLIMTAIAGAAMLLYKWLDKINVTADEQRDIFNDLKTSYDETKSELSSLVTELDSVKKKLDELNKLEALGGLTVNQAEERDELQKTSEELERRIQLLERLEEVKRKGTNDAAYETLQKTSYELTKTTTLDNGHTRHVTESVDAAEYINHYVDMLESAAERKRKVEDQLASRSDLTLEESARYEEDIALIEAEITEYEQAIGDVITEIQPLLDGITDTSGAAYEQKVAIEGAIDAFLNWDKAAEGATESFRNAAAASRQIFPNLTSHVESLKTVEENITALSDALADFRDDGFVTMDTFSDMAEVFGQFPEEFERFVSVASDSASSMTEVQSAANALAKAYLESTDFLASMTEGTTEATIATLKNIGVLNAEEVVMKRLKISKAAATLEEAGLTDATWDAIEAHFKAADAAEVDMEAIYALRVEQLNAKVAAVDFVTATRDTITALYKEAIAVGKATEIWQDYAAALRTKRYLELHSDELTEGQIEYYNQYLQDYQDNIQKKLGDFEVELDVSTAVKPTDSSGKTAAEKAAEEAREAFEKEYNAWKYKLDMERITLEEFYDWLGGQDGYQKYFEAQGETLEDFQKYSKEVFDGLREVQEGYLSDLDHEIGLLEMQEHAENKIVVKYREKQRLLSHLIDETRAYLKSVGLTDDEIARNDIMQEYITNLHEINESIDEIGDKLHDEISEDINSLIDLTEELVKHEAEEMIDVLERERDEYEEIIEAKKQMLNLSKREAEYQDEVAAKTKDISKIQARIAALSLDDSRSAAIERAQLEEELAELQKSLSDTQRDHHIDSTEDALDKELDQFSKAQDEKIEKIEDFLDDNYRVHQEAMNKLDGLTESTFNSLLDYALHYTETTKEELVDMWETAAAAAKKYGNIVNAEQVYSDSDVDNEVQKQLRRMRANGQGWASATSDAERAAYAEDSRLAGIELSELLNVPVWRDNNGEWWVGSGNTKQKLFEAYEIHHDGTASVGGFATPRQNETFSLLENREMVLTEAHQSVLSNWASSLASMLDVFKTVRRTGQFTAPATATAAGPSVVVNAPVHMTGNLDDATMSVLKRHPYDVANIVADKLYKW